MLSFNGHDNVILCRLHYIKTKYLLCIIKRVKILRYNGHSPVTVVDFCLQNGQWIHFSGFDIPLFCIAYCIVGGSSFLQVQSCLGRVYVFVICLWLKKTSFYFLGSII